MQNSAHARPVKPVITALPLLASASVRAADAAPSAASSVAQMLVGLVIVIAALFGTLMLLRRLQTGRTHLVGGLRVIGATNVGPRERVVLVSVGDKVLVLGVTQGRVSALHTLDASELPAEPEPAMKPMAVDFAARLRQFMEKRNAR